MQPDGIQHTIVNHAITFNNKVTHAKYNCNDAPPYEEENVCMKDKQTPTHILYLFKFRNSGIYHIPTVKKANEYMSSML
jgi:hypothetical protein